MPESVYDRCQRTTELFEGGVLCQIGFKPAFSALLILLGYALIALIRQRSHRGRSVWPRCAPGPSRCPFSLDLRLRLPPLEIPGVLGGPKQRAGCHGGVALRVVGWIRLVHRNVTTERLRLRGAGIWMPARVELSDWCQCEAKP
jgi:hypothetical protein